MLPDPDFWRIIAPLLEDTFNEENGGGDAAERMAEGTLNRGLVQDWLNGGNPLEGWFGEPSPVEPAMRGPSLNIEGITDFLKPLLASSESLPGIPMPRLPGMDWLDDKNLPEDGEPWADVPDWVLEHLPLETDVEGGSDDIAGYPGTGQGVSWDDVSWAPPGWRELNNVPGTARRETVPYLEPLGTPNPNFSGLEDFLKPLLAEENLPGEPVTPYRVPLGLSEESYRDWFNQELARRGGASTPESPWGTYPDENPADVRWRPYGPKDIMDTPNPNFTALTDFLKPLLASLPGEEWDWVGERVPDFRGGYDNPRGYPGPVEDWALQWDFDPNAETLEDLTGSVRSRPPFLRDTVDYPGPWGTPNPNFSGLEDFLKPLLAEENLPGEPFPRIPQWWADVWPGDFGGEQYPLPEGNMDVRDVERALQNLGQPPMFPEPRGNQLNATALEDFLRPLLASNNIWDVEGGEDLGLPEAPLSPRTPYDLWDVEQQEDLGSLQDLLPRPVPVRQPGPDVRGPEGVGGSSHALNEPGFFTQLNEYNPVHWLFEALNDQAGVEPEGFNPLTNLGGLWPLLTRFPALVPGV